jgi:hypothetical protein
MQLQKPGHNSIASLPPDKSYHGHHSEASGMQDVQR